MLCTVPALRAIRKNRPNDQVTLIGLPWAREFVKRFSRYLDCFISFPGYPPFPEQVPNIKAFPDFLKKCQEHEFDLLFQMHGDGTFSNLIIPFLGAKKTAGYAGKNSFKPFNDTYFSWPNQTHEIHIFTKLVEKAGFKTFGDYLEFPLVGNDYDEFNWLIKKENTVLRDFICIHPGSRLATRRWLPERFAKVADHYADLGYQIVLTGTEPERLIGNEVLSSMNHQPLNLIGKTSLGALAVLIKKAKMLISNDTGVAHIAAAFKVPSVIIVTGSDPVRWAPLDHDLHKTILQPVPCRPCLYDKCPFDMLCGKKITVEMVYKAVPLH